jgi:dynein light chain LC8-type
LSSSRLRRASRRGTAPDRLSPRAPQALEKYNIEKDIAAFIKKEFDKKYNPTWHCIVGRNFGSYVTHETKHFIYFYLGQVAVLLFKSG